MKNARYIGRETGFAVKLTYIKITKEQFEKIGKHYAHLAYKQLQKQDEYLQGWMECWHEPHPQNCDCEDCQFIRGIIDED